MLSPKLRLDSRFAQRSPCGSSKVIWLTSLPLMVVMRARTSGANSGTCMFCEARYFCISGTSCGCILIMNWLGASLGKLSRQVSIRSFLTRVRSINTIRPSPKATTWITLSRPRRFKLASPYRQATPATPRNRPVALTSSQPARPSTTNEPAVPAAIPSTSLMSRIIHCRSARTATAPAM